MKNKRHLKVWAGLSEGTEPAKLTLADVLYSPPNPDQSRKQCANCLLWQEPQEECLIHDAGVTATADSVCGYHVFGEPGGLHGQRENMQPVEPGLSGLEQVKGGTACGECRHFEKQDGGRQGLCHVAWEEDGDVAAVVQAFGCCAAWESSNA